jgi:SSS family solute:Na+ symporter
MNKNAPDRHYVSMGRWSTIVGMLISVGTAYLVAHAASIMDYVQALFSFFIAPLFGTVVLGMLWKRATRSGGFWGLLSGTIASIAMWIWVQRDAGALRYIALSPDARPMAENLYRALWSFLICVVITYVVSMMTEPTPDAQLAGLVYGATVIPDDGAHALWQKPIFWACIVIVVFFVLNLIFW